MEYQSFSLPSFSKKKFFHPLDLKDKKKVKKQKTFSFKEPKTKKFVEKDPILKEPAPECTEELLDFLQDFPSSDEPHEEVSYEKNATYSSPSFAYSPTYGSSPPGLPFARKDPSSKSLFQSIRNLDHNFLMPPVPPPQAKEKEVKFAKSADLSMSSKLFRCPFCVTDNLPERSLISHILKKHPNERSGVCPICASSPNGIPHYVSKDLRGHLKIRHSSSQASLDFLPSISKPPVHLIQSSQPLDQSQAYLGSKDRADLMWDFILSLDSISLKPNENSQVCCSCKTILKPEHVCAILPCQHIFHTSCVPNQPSPTCPVCDSKKREKKERRRRRSKKSLSKHLEGNVH